MSTQNISHNLFKDWHILVVDDEEDSLMVAEILLVEYGAIVYTAANGEEGLALARKHHPRFILSDLSMPIMDGWGLIESLRNDGTTMDTPVIALTAHAMLGDRERAIAAGFYNYLTKPLTVETFIQSLVRLLIEIPQFSSELNTGEG